MKHGNRLTCGRPAAAGWILPVIAGFILLLPALSPAVVEVGSAVVVSPRASATIAAPAGTIELKEADRGRTIVIRRGQRLRLSLPANPSTGYQWEIAAINRNVLRPEGHSFQRSSRLPGSVGADSFFFRAARPGRTELRLYYVRPFSGGIGPANIWRANIIVDNWLY
ncbi:MAG: protease inhibitor I42 family protein [Candidatus Sumerlaeota bacterium]|nr:protease inhibitor I42 family protein [Candidatus Sumerlaeota bacterium]